MISIIILIIMIMPVAWHTTYIVPQGQGNHTSPAQRSKQKESSKINIFWKFTFCKKDFVFLVLTDNINRNNAPCLIKWMVYMMPMHGSLLSRKPRNLNSLSFYFEQVNIIINIVVVMTIIIIIIIITIISIIIKYDLAPDNCKGKAEPSKPCSAASSFLYLLSIMINDYW